MNPLTCEMCGSTEIIRKDGVYVCQACGTKYSIEDAKSMMAEGTVKIDTSDSINNFLTLATTASNGNNMDEAFIYSNKILELDPSNAEAWKIKLEATCRLATSDDYKVNDVLISAKKVLELSKGKYDADVYETVLLYLGYAYAGAVYELTNNLVAVKILYEANLGKYSDSEIARQETMEADRIMQSTNMKVHDLWQLREFVPDSEIEKSEKLKTIIRQVAENYIGYVDALRERLSAYNTILTPETFEFINKQLSNLQSGVPEKDRIKYSEPSNAYNSNNSQDSSRQQVTQTNEGCYIATAYYGSYDCPEVWMLRRYRDFTLAETWAGQKFITLYYTISPLLVKWFGKSIWFKKICRLPLETLVKYLQDKGVENSPYKDRTYKLN